MAAARDAALQQSEQIAQELVQRDAEICGLLLKITKQDAALKVTPPCSKSLQCVIRWLSYCN
jgi:hypothetical protein